MGSQGIRDGVQSEYEGSEIKRDASGTWIGLPDQKSLGRSRLLLVRMHVRFVESGGVSSIDLIVPFSSDTPLGVTVAVNHFSANVISGRRLPAPSFEFEVTHLSGSPILDHHGAIVVDGWVSSDNVDHRRRDFLPGVKFLASGSRP